MKLYPNVEAIYNHANEGKAGVCILYPRGLLRMEKACNFYPTHTTYADFNLGKAEYRLIAVYGPESHGDIDLLIYWIFKYIILPRKGYRV